MIRLLHRRLLCSARAKQDDYFLPATVAGRGAAIFPDSTFNYTRGIVTRCQDRVGVIAKSNRRRVNWESR